jgi:hypothetical protein
VSTHHVVCRLTRLGQNDNKEARRLFTETLSSPLHRPPLDPTDPISLAATPLQAPRRCVAPLPAGLQDELLVPTQTESTLPPDTPEGGSSAFVPHNTCSPVHRYPPQCAFSGCILPPTALALKVLICINIHATQTCVVRLVIIPDSIHFLIS